MCRSFVFYFSVCAFCLILRKRWHFGGVSFFCVFLLDTETKIAFCRCSFFCVFLFDIEKKDSILDVTFPLFLFVLLFMLVMDSDNLCWLFE